jgi:L-threonylcarbamoyladenylate synthase
MLLDPLNTQVLQVDPAAPDPAAIQAAARVLLAGGLVSFPTETVYGLGANALDALAVGRIFAAKGRPASDPLIVHLAAPAGLEQVAEGIPALAYELARAFWPGPLTLVLRRGARVPANVAAGRDTVAVRTPNHRVPLELARVAGVPIAAPSANLFTRPSPTLAQHVLDDLRGRVDLVLDGGPTPIGLESTVLDLTQDPPAVLRPGGLPIEALQPYIPSLTFQPAYLKGDDEAAQQASPGMLLKHYSPSAQIILFTGPAERVLAEMRATAQRLIRAGKRVGIMAADEDSADFAALGVRLASLGAQHDLPHVGQRVFASMRELDSQGVDVILVRGLDREGIGLAIWDRLVRAAEGHVIEVP